MARRALPSEALLGPLLVLGASVLWGTTGTAQAFAPSGATPPLVGALRLAIGGAALLVYALWRGHLHATPPWPPLVTLCAAGAVAAYQLCFFAAVASTGVAVGTIVAIGSSPVLAGALGFAFRGERLTRAWLAATALAVLGCSLLAGASGEVRVEPLGVALALGAGGCYALYALLGKRLIDDHHPDAVMAVLFTLGALALSPLLVLGDLRWALEPRGLAVVLHLGLLATAAAYVLFGRGLARVPVGTAGTLSLGEPLTAGLLGVLVLGERLSPPATAGLLALLAGLAWLTLANARRR